MDKVEATFGSNSRHCRSMLIAAPAAALMPPSWPSGTRIRYDAEQVRRLRYRKFHRAKLTVTVLTVVGPHAATVRGISLFGACLHGGRRLRRREMVALKLPSGYRITGRVRWRLGSRAGVTFSSPVADFARLISEGALVRSGRRRRPSHPDRPRMLFAAAAQQQEPYVGDSGLSRAVAKAWSIIERAIAARGGRSGADVRPFD
jgi:hypothetical protein